MLQKEDRNPRGKQHHHTHRKMTRMKMINEKDNEQLEATAEAMEEL